LAARMNRTRILYCIDSLGLDAGTEIQLTEMIRRIDKEKFEIHLCCFEESPRMQELSAHCTPIVLPVRKLLSINGLKQIRRLRHYIKTNDIDIVHTWMVDANIVGTLAAIGSGCKASVSSRRNLGYWWTPKYRVVYWCLNRYTTRFLANSHRVRDAVIEAEGVSSEKVDVIHNGVDATRYTPGCGDPSVLRSLGVPDGMRIVGIVGNLRPVKDHALFLRAAKLIAESVPDVGFVLVGVGPLRHELAEQAEDLGIKDQVFFSNGKGAVVDYLGRMCIGCLSSESEGFSNALLEYMAVGLPVVATQTGGNIEAVENGVSGYLVPPGDFVTFANRIIELLNDEKIRAKMGREALARCRTMFDIGGVIQCYEDYYAELALGARQGS